MASRGAITNSTKAYMATTTLKIEGMTCGACTSAVEGGFKDMPGVVQFSISLLAERGVIIHDPTILSTEKIVEIIEDRGFNARLLSSQIGSGDQTKAVSMSQFKIFGVKD